jgi:peptide/nickel transport system ATP-binding protein
MASMPKLPQAGEAQARLTEIAGTVPSLVRLPPGCAFAPRCALAIDRCRSDSPPLRSFGHDHQAACWRADERAEAS